MSVYPYQDIPLDKRKNFPVHVRQQYEDGLKPICGELNYVDFPVTEVITCPYCLTVAKAEANVCRAFEE